MVRRGSSIVDYSFPLCLALSVKLLRCSLDRCVALYEPSNEMPVEEVERWEEEGGEEGVEGYEGGFCGC